MEGVEPTPFDKNTVEETTKYYDGTNDEMLRAAREDTEQDITENEAEAMANDTQEKINQYIENLKEIYKDGGSGFKFIEEFGSENLNMDSETIEKVKSAYKKIFGKEPPFGYIKDSYGNYVRDTDIWPDDIELTSDDVPDISNFIKSRIKFEKNINTKLGNELEQDEIDAFNEYANKSGEYSRKALELPEPPSDVAEAMKKDPLDLSDSEKIQQFFNDEYKKWLKNKPDELNKKINKNRVDSNKDTDKPYSKWKTFSYIIIFLQFAGSIAAVLYFLISCANAHTGCMNISKLGKNEFVNSEKVLCGSDGKTYTPNVCYCDENEDYQKFSGTADHCSNMKTKGSTTPRPAQVTDVNRQCLGDVNKGIQDNFRYYAYQIMSPLDAIPYLIQKSGEALDKGASPIIEELIKAAIILGIIIAVLIVLFIIYKFVSNRASAKKIEIEPEKVAEFGKYLGNLNKFSNYSTMRKCGTIR